jgi:hypothetical protein
LLQPSLGKGHSVDAAPWADALVAVNDAVQAAGGPANLCFFVSGHASLEELFILRELAKHSGGLALGWRHRPKPQPAGTKFPIPAVDAPNLRGARDLGFDVGQPGAPADLSQLKAAVTAGHAKVLYVVDPGPDLPFPSIWVEQRGRRVSAR